MRVTLVAWHVDADVLDEEALLARYSTLTGWADALRETGARVSVVLRFHRDSQLTHGEVDYRFCRVEASWIPGFDRPRGRFMAAVRAARPDVVHVNGLQFATLAWHLRRRLPETCAVVVQDHASRYPVEPGGAAQRLKRAALRRAMQAPDGYLFTAAAQAVPWQAAGLIRPSQVMRPVPEGSTTLSPAAVDEARAATGISGSPAILWVGRLNANKDPLCVVDACAAVQATYPALTLTMVFGDDDLLSEVRRRVGGHVALAPKVRLMGRVPHDRMALVYSAADIFVLGSHYEGSGFALIEACACGVPPAVTDIPSFRALTGAGRIGALWRVGDPYACADAICRVASAAAPGQRDAVRAHFERSLSWSAIGRLALASYGQLLIERRATASCIATP